MGLDDKSTSLIPEWKRGHFSLLFDGSAKPAALLFLDHRKKRYFDLTAERKKQSTAIDAEVCPGSLHVRMLGAAPCVCAQAHLMCAYPACMCLQIMPKQEVAYLGMASAAGLMVCILALDSETAMPVQDTAARQQQSLAVHLPCMHAAGACCLLTVCLPGCRSGERNDCRRRSQDQDEGQRVQVQARVGGAGGGADGDDRRLEDQGL